jgi:hypothetical protein
MTAYQITNPHTPALIRGGSIDVDEAVLGCLRAYVLAADEARAAEAKRDMARTALDAALGSADTALYRGTQVLRFVERSRRDIDLDRLADRHPAAYEDCVRESITYAMKVEPQVRNRLRPRAWRSAVRELAKRVGA